MRALVKIGDYDFPEPSEYVGTTSTFVDSARNVEGYVVGSVIREDVAKVELTWKFLSKEDWSNILRLFNTKYGGKFYLLVEFFNETSGDWEIREMYVGDRKGGMFKRDHYTGEVLGYLNVKLSLIEV